MGLVPHGSLTPFGVGAAPLAAETHPNLDVDFVHKDKDGNDLFDLDIDAIEDKSWRKPGANMADYFNYGMNEPAWKNYARKQRLTRQEESAEKNPFAVRQVAGGEGAQAADLSNWCRRSRAGTCRSRGSRSHPSSRRS